MFLMIYRHFENECVARVFTNSKSVEIRAGIQPYTIHFYTTPMFSFGSSSHPVFHIRSYIYPHLFLPFTPTLWDFTPFSAENRFQYPVSSTRYAFKLLYLHLENFGVFSSPGSNFVFSPWWFHSKLAICINDDSKSLTLSEFNRPPSVKVATKHSFPAYFVHVQTFMFFLKNEKN